jgi:CDP-diacylglycerol---serine O-phosphatidyltransferase
VTHPQSPLACFHPSNTVTYLSLLAGVGSIAAAAHGSGSAAGALIALAAIADTFDGRLARRFIRSDSMRAFGAELDSLCDVAVFGAAPIICAAWLNPPLAGPQELFWWGCAFAYVACCVTRLGFYNLADDAEGFVGVPAPAAALLWSTLRLTGPAPGLEAALLGLAGAAMVAPIRVPRPAGAGLAAFVAWPLGLLGVYLDALLR